MRTPATVETVTTQSQRHRGGRVVSRTLEGLPTHQELSVTANNMNQHKEPKGRTNPAFSSHPESSCWSAYWPNTRSQGQKAQGSAPRHRAEVRGGVGGLDLAGGDLQIPPPSDGV